MTTPRYCLDCGAYTETGNRCPNHTKQAEQRRANDPHRSTRRTIYRDTRWKHARDIAIANADHRCEECGQPDDIGSPLTVHHAAGYSNPYDPDGLEVLCARCHGRRDGAKARRRAS